MCILIKYESIISAFIFSQTFSDFCDARDLKKAMRAFADIKNIMQIIDLSIIFTRSRTARDGNLIDRTMRKEERALR